MNKKKMLALVLGLVVTVIVVALVLNFSNKHGGTVIIGGVLPLTGDAGTFGENASRGAQLAVEHANEQNLGNGIRFVFRAEDSRGDATQAVSAGQKLIDSDGAKLLIGDVTSAGTHALIPLAERNKIPLISPAASDPALTGVSRYFCRVWPSDNYEAQVIGKHAIEKRYEHLAFVYANTDYGVAMVDEMSEVVSKNRISLRVPVEREATSLRPVVERVKQSNSDAIFMVLYPEDAKRFLQQLTELHVSLPILGTATFEDPGLASEPHATQVVFASPRPPQDDSADRMAFLKRYRAKFGKDPGVLSDVGYDATMILIRAYTTSSNADPTSVMKHIRELKNYPGISGSLTFDKNGDVEKPYGLKTVRDGAFVWLD